MLEGIRIKSIVRRSDERGFFSEVMRNNWGDLFGDDDIVQINYSYTYPNIIRAWHRHIRDQVDYFLVLSGSIKLCAFDEQNSELSEIISSGTELQVVRVPGHYWHGFKAIGTEPVVLVYYTTKLYDIADPDEERRVWNDPTIIAQSINGNRSDVRVGKSWDWNAVPHR
ncbi:MAG: dTDP-4-dehydrorhamnose 3,5-epimerase family protein [Nitrososphaerota archaeon]|nr:dTDP-4-dehydrorhamnose 3,5-epimerase family protein [Nitrososphaerota archaeon]